MVTLEPRERPQTWTMAVTHQAFRREFELAPRIVRDLTPGEWERHQQAKSWFATMLSMMHHHHAIEDDLMYPLLEGRVAQPLLDRMAQQHQRLADAVDQAELMLARWKPADAPTAEALARAFDDMLPVLVEHVDAEEREIMPLVAEHLTAAQYERQGSAGNRSDPAALMMCFGSVVEQATQSEAAVMMAYPPAPIRRAWHEHGEREYRALMALLRGRLQPIARQVPSGLSVPSSP